MMRLMPKSTATTVSGSDDGVDSADSASDDSASDDNAADSELVGAALKAQLSSVRVCHSYTLSVVTSFT